MKNKINKFLLLLLFIIIIIAPNAMAQLKINNAFPRPTIDGADAIVSGKIDKILMQKVKQLKLTFYISSPIVGSMEYMLTIRKDGCFQRNIPVLCEGFAFYELRADAETYRFYTTVAPKKSTSALFTLDKNGGPTIANEKNPLNYFNKEFRAMMDSLNFFQITNQNKLKCNNGNISLQAYYKSLLQKNQDMMLDVDTAKLCVRIKQELFIDLTMQSLLQLFAYQEMASNYYNNWIEDNNKDTKDFPFVAPKADKSYYRFMKDFDFNNPYYLYSPFYQSLVSYVLEAKELSIPPIGDSVTHEWAAKLKENLKDLLGFSDGLFYDVLVAGAYNSCLMNKVPFTDTQKKNLVAYFNNNAYAKLLLAKNNELLATLKEDAAKKVVINKTPEVPKEQMLDKIVEKYKGKVVYVDFWATWCGPCIKATREFEPLKSIYKDKDVVYVYITNVTSNQKDWQLAIKGIEGEHYYLDNDSWDYMFDKLGISGIPTSLIYDKNGVMKHKKTVMRTKEIVDWIGELL